MESAPPERRRRGDVWPFVLAIVPFFVNGWINALIAGEAWLYWGFEILCWLVIPLAAWHWARRHGGPDWVALGYRWTVAGRTDRRYLAVYLLLAAAFGPALYGLAETLTTAAFGTRTVFSYASVIPAHGWPRVAVVLWFGLSAGFVEETLYRAWAWHLLARKPHATSIYLLVMPLVFALVHWEGGVANVAAAWLYGVVAAAAYLRLRNLWPLIVAHCAADFVAFA